MVTGAYGKPMANQFGAPLRLAVPWKYGFKSIKSIRRVSFTETRPVSFWEEIAPSEYGFWANVNVPGSGETLNQALERAGRVADFIELGELMCRDALEREESCGGHFREEYQYPDGECKRDDEKFGHVAAWDTRAIGKAPLRTSNRSTTNS